MKSDIILIEPTIHLDIGLHREETLSSCRPPPPLFFTMEGRREEEEETGFLERAYNRLRQQTTATPTNTFATTTTTTTPNNQPAPLLPTQTALAQARASLPRPSDPDYLLGRGPDATLDHVLGTIAPALNGQNLGSGGRYWGFVTGSTLPVAEAADNVVSAYDQNVCVHLPAQSVATEVEDAALGMVVDLLELEGCSSSSGGGDGEKWRGRTFTTGATASNVLGMACGREAVVRMRLGGPGAGAGAGDGVDEAEDGDEEEEEDTAVGELGLLRACAKAQIDEIRILTSMAHSSIYKAASIVGLGRASVRDLPYSEDEPWRLDLDAVERELRENPRVAHIISVSAGEVNTGRFATGGIEDMRRLRELADTYKAWVHVDGGRFARCDYSFFLQSHERDIGHELMMILY